MLRYVLLFLFATLSLCVQAQEMDSLFAVRKGEKWAIKYQLKKGETPHMIAQRFYVSDRELE